MNPEVARTVIFSDMDGTLLDHDTYSAKAAHPALNRLARLQIPIVLVSSKTHAEIATWQRQLGLAHPFVTENGSAIHLPEGYFQRPLPPTRSVSRDAIGKVLAELREEFTFTSFRDLGTAGIVQQTGLDRDAAALANQRQASEPLVFEQTDRLEEFRDRLRPHGLKAQFGGRFLHVMGETSKGHALRRLMTAYATDYGRDTSVALGDGPNDASMLEVADFAVVIKGAKPVELRRQSGILRPNAPGPAGWNEAIDQLFPKTNQG